MIWKLLEVLKEKRLPSGMVKRTDEANELWVGSKAAGGMMISIGIGALWMLPREFVIVSW